MRRRRHAGAWPAAGALAAGLLVLAGCAIAPAPGDAGSPPPRPTGGATATAGPDDVPDPEEPPGGGTAGAPALPRTCEGLYSGPQRAQLTALGLELQGDLVGQNPKFASAPELGDPELAALAAERLVLACTWAPPEPGHTYIHSALLAGLTPGEAASVAPQLASAGHTCREELGGTRCTAELDGVYDAGYSSFVRGDVWLLTFWSSLAPQDYTNQIVVHLWPAAT